MYCFAQKHHVERQNLPFAQTQGQLSNLPCTTLGISLSLFTGWQITPKILAEVKFQSELKSWFYLLQLKLQLSNSNEQSWLCFQSSCAFHSVSFVPKALTLQASLKMQLCVSTSTSSSSTRYKKRTQIFILMRAAL